MLKVTIYFKVLIYFNLIYSKTITALFVLATKASRLAGQLEVVAAFTDIVKGKL